MANALDFWRTGSHYQLLRLGAMPLPMDVSALPLSVWERWQGVPINVRRGDQSAALWLARLGAVDELMGTREEMRDRGVRPPPKTITTGAAGLTGREIEIARMVASRKSNKEIGGALQISSRTVSTHLSNIFVKLSVTSRGELADFVRQSGLLEG